MKDQFHSYHNRPVRKHATPLQWAFVALMLLGLGVLAWAFFG